MRANFLKRVKRLLCSITIAVFFVSSAGAAEIAAQDAINHLLTFVETSRCTFKRNGVEYDSREAADHIKKKYNYFKGEIHTAEDFIALAATKSELSGKPYWVRCGKGKEMRTADWLREELQRQANKKER
jgi:hypothetical protein